MDEKKTFYEYDLIKKLRLEVVEQTLIDRNGITRTCLNFPEAAYIQCNKERLNALGNDVPTQYVLVFHELLGLLGVEESSPNEELIRSYSISSRLKAYVQKVSTYNLVYKNLYLTPSTQYREARNLIYTNMGCNVSKLILIKNHEPTSELKEEVIAQLSKKGYKFKEESKTNNHSFRDEGLAILMGTEIGTWIDTGTYTPLITRWARSFYINQHLELATGQVHSSELIKRSQKHLAIFGKYDYAKAIKWILKTIPECHNQ